MSIKYYRSYLNMIEKCRKNWIKNHKRSEEFPFSVDSRYTFEKLDPFVRKQIMDALRKMSAQVE